MPEESAGDLSELVTNPWFYGFIAGASLLFFVCGLLTATYIQNPGPSIDTILNTEVPEWLKSTRQNDERKSLGNPDAPVTIVEYMDVECPYCKRYSKRIFPRIVKDYVRPGKVYYKIRHFPLTRAHPNALKGGVAAECAADQGRFWEFKTVALNNRSHLSPKLLRMLGKIINVPDPEKYKECVKNDRYLQTVKEEFRKGRQKGVSGTPTVFVNGQSLSGVPSYEKIKGMIDEELKNSSTS